MKILYTTLGFISLGIGCVGIVVEDCPLPRLFFLQLLFSQKALNAGITGLFPTGCSANSLKILPGEKGMSLKIKIISISMMWAMITISAMTFKSLHMKLFLLVMGIIGTVVMGFIVKTIKVKKEA
ncbi:MAG: hypothetical protein MZV70_77485 [Desulfobacterales bacterium]|nr:hypothetical protein [Desulfobacterales bacterium]